MTKPEGKTELQIGMLVLEQSTLEKQISKLRDQMSERAKIFARVGRLLVLQPERLVFEGQTVDEQFAGEPAIDRKAMDVDSLIAELRAAIARKSASTAELAELGIDLEEAERERNQRASRALFHPANVRFEPEDDQTKRDGVGFVGSRRKGRS